VLATCAASPLIERVFERMRAASLVGATFVLTSDDPSDDPLAAFLDERGIPYRRGPLADVRARYLALVDELQPRYLARITGDCPFVEPAFLDLRVETLRARDGDLAPVGNDPRGEVEGVLASHDVCSARALRLSLESDDPRDREHVASFFFARHDPRLKRVEVQVPERYRRAGLRLSVDEPADLELARAVWAAVDREGDGLFPLRRALRWIDEHPEVRELNRHVQSSADNRELLRQRRESA
jgi:spore coat polysaccharide biosynthesis protein SpsF